MEKSLTAAGRVRRRFKAGRPRAISNENLSPLQAINRFCSELDRARNLMRDEGLDPKDIGAALVYSTPQLRWFYEFLPSGNIGAFISRLEALQNPQFLGILFAQRDLEADPQGIAWLIPYMGGPENERKLLEAKSHFLREGHKAFYD